MAFCTTRKFKNGKWVTVEKRVFNSREAAEPFRVSLEKSTNQPAEVYRCPRCYELHIGRIPTKVPNTWGSGDWDKLAGKLIKSLRKTLDHPTKPESKVEK